jgi:Putative Ig domain
VSLIYPVQCPVIPDPFLNNSSEAQDLPQFEAVGFCKNGQEVVAFSLASQDDANAQLDALMPGACAVAATGPGQDGNAPWQTCIPAICPDGTILASFCDEFDGVYAQAEADLLVALCCDGLCSASIISPYAVNWPGGDDGGFTLRVTRPGGATRDFPRVTPGSGTLAFYVSSEQQCTFTCPDGIPFVYTVPAGYTQARTQAAADKIAFDYACQQADLNVICLGDISTGAGAICANADALINVDAGVGPSVGTLTYMISEGQLPTGMSISGTANGFAISGTPVQSGSFDFTVKATDTNGNFMEKPYSLNVLGLQETSLPDATVGSVYNYQLQGQGGDDLTFATDPIVIAFTYTPTTLPTGLTCSASGLITGTPEYSGTCKFNVYVTSGATTCTIPVTLTIDPLKNGPQWGSMVWTTAGFVACSCSAKYGGTPGSNVYPPSGFQGPGGVFGATGGGEDLTDGGAANGNSVTSATGNLYYTGPTVFCKIIWVVDQANPPAASAGLLITQDGKQVEVIDFLSNVSPAVFAITAGTNSHIQVIGASNASQPFICFGQGFRFVGSPGNVSIAFELQNQS